jgi:hypothetical protein
MGCKKKSLELIEWRFSNFPNMESKVSISMNFSFEPELDDMMNQSIEMGRAFIIGIPAETHASFLALERNIHTTREHKYLLVG